MRNSLHLLFTVVFSLAFTHCQYPKSKVIDHHSMILTSKERIDHQSAEAKGVQYAIATQGNYATLAGEEIFKLGGNAVDAAIAASFTISVERPHSTGLGGGGFMLYYEAKTHKTYAIDFRERAPLKAFEKMYLDKNGKVDPSQSIDGIKAAAVPGLVAGLIEIHQRFGKLPLSTILKPAITLAKSGFIVYPSLAFALSQRADVLKKDREASRIFLNKNLEPLKVGDLLIQKDLAQSLERIAKSGKNGFYQGITEKLFLDFNSMKGGLLTKDDFKSYQVKWREPVKGNYNGNEIYSMPPPSSGGIHVIQFLNMLEEDKLNEIGPFQKKSIHLAASALQSAFADRATYLGDPDFTHVPTNTLISKEYVKKRRAEFFTDHARSYKEVSAGKIDIQNGLNEHTETTHLSLMDLEGNAISTTQTINGYMGAGMVVPHTGIVLNNEMDDFSASPGTANLFGAIGGSANAIAPRKTPLSSMSPTIVVKNGLPIMAVGAPGGTRIISCVAQTILNYLEYKMPLYQSVTAIRYHHQWQVTTQHPLFR